MKIKDLAKQVKEANPEKLGKVNERRIALIIKSAFEQLKTELNNAEDDIVRVPKLGNFKLKKIEKEKDGKKTVLKRIVFNPSKK